jgi:hypothetical protein
MINYSSLIASKLENLPVEKQQQVLDFVEFLAQKTTLAQNDIKRVPDLHQGKIWMSYENDH